MFRKLRREKQSLSEKECIEILKKGEEGVLAVNGDDGYPYTVPINYLYSDGKIYFHSAIEGHKIDGINKDDKVSFCVIDKKDIIPEELDTLFRSVVVFGRGRIIKDKEEKRNIGRIFGLKYNPDEERVMKSVNSSLHRMAIIEVSIEHMSGKESLKLTNKRK